METLIKIIIASLFVGLVVITIIFFTITALTPLEFSQRGGRLAKNATSSEAQNIEKEKRIMELLEKYFGPRQTPEEQATGIDTSPEKTSVPDFLVEYLQTPSKEQPDKVSPETERTTQNDKEAIQLIDEALTILDPFLCDKIEKTELRNRCISNIILVIANKEKDYDLCDKIVDKKIAVNCKDSITTAQALNDKNRELCDTMIDKSRIKNCKEGIVKEEIKEEINQIIREAKGNRDRTLCEKIGNEYDKERCLSSVIISQASDAQDASLCNQITNEYRRAGCKDNVIIVTARAAKDPNLCDALNDESRVEKCKEMAQ